MTDLAPTTGGLSPQEAEAHALAAVEAVDSVSSPEEAEELLRRITAYQQAVRLAKIGQEQERRWAGIRLQAEKKMGDLIGPAEHGGDRRSEESSGSVPLEQEDKDARKFARKVAAVPDSTFAAYIATAEMPTRAGLLRVAKPAPDAPEQTLAPNSRRVHQQVVLVRSIASQARLIALSEPNLDLEAIRSISEEEKEQWKQQLCDARTVLSRVIGAL